MEEALKDSILGALEMVIDPELVWSPPWNKDMMSRYAKIALGIG